jgi:uncharacterized tellurite resistance protein B-like protein
MNIWAWLRGGDPAGRPHAGDTETVRRIVAELDRLEPARARHLAAFAYVLSRVAGADRHVSQAETDTMVEILRRVGQLPEEQALLVTEIAKNQNRLFGGTENFLVTREFRDVANEGERRDLLDCLFAVSAADAAVSGEEESQIWQIASELGFSHREYVDARLAYSDLRTVLRPPRAT